MAHSEALCSGRTRCYWELWQNWILRRRGRAGAGNAALAATMIVVLAAAFRIHNVFSYPSSKDLALAISQPPGYRPVT